MQWAQLETPTDFVKIALHLSFLHLHESFSVAVRHLGCTEWAVGVVVLNQGNEVPGLGRVFEGKYAGLGTRLTKYVSDLAPACTFLHRFPEFPPRNGDTRPGKCVGRWGFAKSLSEISPQ